jgi:hypothetical protein
LHHDAHNFLLQSSKIWYFTIMDDRGLRYVCNHLNKNSMKRSCI